MHAVLGSASQLRPDVMLSWRPPARHVAEMHCMAGLQAFTGNLPGSPSHRPQGTGVVERNGPGASKFKPGKEFCCALLPLLCRCCRRHRCCRRCCWWCLPACPCPPLLYFSRSPTTPRHQTTTAVPRAGQRVTASPFPARSGHGTWQQYICVGEDVLLAVPDGVSDEAAAQFLVSLQVCCACLGDSEEEELGGRVELGGRMDRGGGRDMYRTHIDPKPSQRTAPLPTPTPPTLLNTNPPLGQQINPVTCFGFFHELSIPKGEWLLSNAAASTLGRMIIQMAKHYVS